MLRSLVGSEMCIRDREMIALAVSQANNCRYCLSAHSEFCSMGTELESIDIIRARLCEADDPKDQAMLDLAVAIVERRGELPESQLENARENGLSNSVVIEIISKSGFKGIEPMHFWMGDYSDPNMLSDKLKKEKIDLAGIALCLEWNGPIETEQEKLEADKIISLLSHFPDAVLCMCQLPTSRNDLINRRINLVNNINSVAELVGNRHNNIKFYEESCTVNFGNIPIFFCPWINSENYGSTLKGIQETNAEVCMGLSLIHI